MGLEGHLSEIGSSNGGGGGGKYNIVPMHLKITCHQKGRTCRLGGGEEEIYNQLWKAHTITIAQFWPIRYSCIE